MSKLPEKQQGNFAHKASPRGECESVSGITGHSDRHDPYALLMWQITLALKWQMVFVQELKFANNQSDIETSRSTCTGPE
jgi:hypothetical protein